MRLNDLYFNDSRKRDYLRDTLDIINGGEKVADFSDVLFYFRTLKKIEKKYPYPELKSIFNPINIYPFYYFMPFLFVNNLPEKSQYKEKIRQVGIISTLIARRTILTDLFADEQYEQIISRDMGGLKKENLGYYIQLAQACRVAGITHRTFQRWFCDGQLKPDGRPSALRPEPANKLTENEREQVLRVCSEAEFSSLPPSRIVPMLADRGIYLASESSFYRILKAEHQLHHRGNSKPRGTYVRPVSYTARGPNQVWSWDITHLPGEVKGERYYLYMIMDVYSRKIVAAEVREVERGEYAAALLQRAVIVENCRNSGLILHSDNGAPMKSFTMLAKMYELGVCSSFSRPRVSNDNPYPESLFRTLKYCPEWPVDGFNNISKAREWVHSFIRWYNTQHRHSGIKFVTPEQRHLGLDKRLLKQREAVYEAARYQHPERWSGKTRNWKPINIVALNPENEHRRAA